MKKKICSCCKKRYKEDNLRFLCKYCYKAIDVPQEWELKDTRLFKTAAVNIE